MRTDAGIVTAVGRSERAVLFRTIKGQASFDMLDAFAEFAHDQPRRPTSMVSLDRHDDVAFSTRNLAEVSFERTRRAHIPARPLEHPASPQGLEGLQRAADVAAELARPIVGLSRFSRGPSF